MSDKTKAPAGARIGVRGRLAGGTVRENAAQPRCLRSHMRPAVTLPQSC